MVDEHDVRSSSALGLLVSSAQWQAIASMLRERAFAVGPASLTMSKTKSTEGTSVSTSMGDLLRLAALASSTGRGDLLSALALEREAREQRPPEISAEVQARLAEIVARRRQNELDARTREAAEADSPPTSPEDAPDDAEAPEAGTEPESPVHGDVARAQARPDPDAARAKERHDNERLRQELLAGQEQARQRARASGMVV
jgi:hypothetical protein